MVSEMCPKIGSVQDADLGSVRMPKSLLSRLENYCIHTHRTKSDVVRSAVTAWVKGDMNTIMENCKMEYAENNGHDGGKSRNHV